MSIFYTGVIPETSPNRTFLRELNLERVCDEEIKNTLQAQFPEDVTYSVWCRTIRDLKPTSVEDNLMRTTWEGREVSLTWKTGVDFLWFIPKFLEGLIYPCNEEYHSSCNKRAIERVFTRTSPNSLEDASEEQVEESNNELRKLFRQGGNILFKISNDRRFFEVTITDNWSKKSYVTGEWVREKMTYFQSTKNRFMLSRLCSQVNFAIQNAKELVPLEKTRPTNPTMAQANLRSQQLDKYRAEFAQSIQDALFSFGKESQLRAVNEEAENSEEMTYPEFTTRRLELLRDSLESFIQEQGIEGEQLFSTLQQQLEQVRILIALPETVY